MNTFLINNDLLRIGINSSCVSSIQLGNSVQELLRTYQGIHGIYIRSSYTNSPTIPDSTESSVPGHPWYICQSNEFQIPLTQIQLHKSNYTKSTTLKLLEYIKCIDFAVFYKVSRLHKLCNWGCHRAVSSRVSTVYTNPMPLQIQLHKSNYTNSITQIQLHKINSITQNALILLCFYKVFNYTNCVIENA